MDGRCQCGSIKFKTPLPEPLVIYVCHCTECRHQSSSAFGVSAIFPSFDLGSSQYEAIGVYNRDTRSGSRLNCLFCEICGSRLIHRVEAGEDTLCVKGGCLERLSLQDAIHIWCKEAIVEIPAGARTFDEEPDYNH